MVRDLIQLVVSESSYRIGGSDAELHASDSGESASGKAHTFERMAHGAVLMRVSLYSVSTLAQKLR